MITQVVYRESTETIAAVYAGMSLSAEENTLVIGGSGEQAISMVDSVASMNLIECDKAQYRYIKNRLEKELTQEQRKKIELTYKEIFSYLEEQPEKQKFDRIYLSNVLGYTKSLDANHGNINSLDIDLKLCTNNLNKEGLIYIANRDIFDIKAKTCVNDKKKFPQINKYFQNNSIPFQVEEDLSNLAISLEEILTWNPVVLKKY